jgi:signal transduction histidine kinase
MLLENFKSFFKITKTLEFLFDNSISSSNIVSNLIEDLLTLAKIKNNKFELNIEENVSLIDIVMDAFQVLSFNAESKNISFKLEFESSRT